MALSFKEKKIILHVWIYYFVQFSLHIVDSEMKYCKILKHWRTTIIKLSYNRTLLSFLISQLVMVCSKQNSYLYHFLCVSYMKRKFLNVMAKCLSFKKFFDEKFFNSVFLSVKFFFLSNCFPINYYYLFF